MNSTARCMVLALAVLMAAWLGAACGSDGDGAGSGGSGGSGAATGAPSQPRPVTEVFEIDPNEAQDLSAESGAGVAFGAGSLVTLNGEPPSARATVEIANYLGSGDVLPSDMPGSFAGNAADGSSVALVSYGVIGINIIDSSGEELNLKPGATATLTIPSIVGGDGPTTAPLWYMPDDGEVWTEEGVATLVGSAYEATVSHFSLWNVDLKCDRACIKGKVTDQTGVPLSGVEVFTRVGSTTCQFFNPGALAGGSAITQADGSYEINWLPGDSTLEVWAVHNGEKVSKPVTIPAAGNACVDVDTLVFGAPKDCNTELTTGIWGWKGDETTPGDFLFKDIKSDLNGDFKFFFRRQDPAIANGFGGVYADSVVTGTWTMTGCTGDLTAPGQTMTFTLTPGKLTMSGEDYANFAIPQTSTGAATGGQFP